MFLNVSSASVRRGLAAASLFGLLFSLATPARSQGASSTGTLTTIDDSGAGTGAQQGTVVTAVDAAGDIAGVYIDTSNVLHCFVRPAGGSISNCDVSGAGSSLGEGTFPTTINTSGVVAGSYVDGSQISHGFVRAVNGTITTFNAPAASLSKNRGTTVLSINDSGVIIGTYTTGTYSTTSVYGGFMRSADGLTFTTINDPNEGTGEGTNSKKQGTTPVAMNASGMITGYYIDSSTVQHGFVRSASGTYTTIDPTGVGTCVNHNNGSNFGGTTASGIDAAGDVAGTYLDTSCVQHGFIRNSSGTISSFDVPGADSNPCTTGGGSGEKICGTFLVLSDAAGDLTGSYIDTNGTIHGFLRPAETGIITSFDDPNASTSGSLNGTLGIAINSQAGGVEIAGSYLDANSVLHGFTYIPALTATTTTLTPVPTPNPSIYQEPVTLTASVSSSGSAPPNGENVTFQSGTTTLGTAQLTSGTASLTTTALPTGTDSITAAYSGDADFSGSTSSPVTETVGKAASYLMLTSSLNPSTYGQSVTLKASITGQFGGTATGSVTFVNGTTTLGTATLSGGSAQFATSTLAVGTSSITASYGGDTNYNATSSALKQTVNKGTPTVTLTSSLNPSTVGASVTFTATLTTTGPSPTAAVAFLDGTTTLATVSPSSGVAKYTTTALAAGTHLITASFVGGPDYNAAKSGVLTQTVNSGTKTNPTLSVTNSPVTYNGTAQAAVVKGSVAGMVSNVLYSGSATVPSTPGTYAITANFTPTDTTDYNSLTAASAGNFVINKDTPVIVLTSSLNPSTVGAAVTFTVALTGSGIAPGGPVTFLDGTTALVTVTPSGGVAKYTTTALAGGMHSITASFAGGIYYNPVNSSVLTQTVNKTTPTVTLTSSLNPSNVGAAVTFTVTLTGSGIAPGGPVTFLDGTTALVTVTPSGGVAKYTTTALAGGTHSITASFAGGIYYNPVNSSVLTQTVNKTTPTVTLTSSVNPSTMGAAVTFTVTLTGSGIAPGGPVTFLDGTTALVTVTPSGGVAKYTTTALAAGTHSITASFAGGIYYNPVNSSVLKQTVN